MRWTRPDLEIFADPLFEKVFYNLMDNSLKYGGEQLHAIRISSQEEDDNLIITYEDDGVGIAEADRAHLFERGFGKHSGFGLFLSREILSITGISIIAKWGHQQPEHGSSSRYRRGCTVTGRKNQPFPNRALVKKKQRTPEIIACAGSVCPWYQSDARENLML